MSNRTRKSLLQKLIQLSRRTKSRARARARLSFFEPLESRNLMATFAVLNANDSGVGSLRQAILDSNTNVGTDLISFNIPGVGVHTIQPLSALPTINSPVTIDGYTQTGSSVNTLAGPNNAALKIELDGSLAGLSSGLWITAGSTTVRGLAINRFALNGIHLEQGDGNVVEGNFIGTDPTGTIELGNGSYAIGAGSSGFNFYGILIGNTNFPANSAFGSSFNRIGTNGDGVLDAGERNIISGNDGANVVIFGAGSDHNVVAGNLIGTDATGTVSLSLIQNPFGEGYGVGVLGAQYNRIGTDGNGVADAVERNVISGNNSGGSASQHESGIGLLFFGTATENNWAAGNYIGTDVTGTLAIPNQGAGVKSFSFAGLNLIGTNADGIADAAERNIISGNLQTGILLEHSNPNGGTVVAGNFIGTDVSGTQPVPNARGVHILTSAGNLIGGTASAARNVISGNSDYGVSVQLTAEAGNRVQGNFIGVDATGAAALGNLIGVSYSTNLVGGNVLIGGTTPGAGNVISGNRRTGVELYNFNATVQGNYIGTDVSGTVDLGNRGVTQSLDGGVVVNGSNHLIGGSSPGAGNVISGNELHGVFIAGSDNVVQGNYIGTDVTGTVGLGNTNVGVNIIGGSRNMIGGSTPGAGNLISANGRNSAGTAFGANRDGVLIFNVVTADNVVEGNFIGVDANGAALGNYGNGVASKFAPQSHVIGNVIANNNLSGVVVTFNAGVNGIGNNISRNSIFANTRLGIDLADNGVTLNDLGDADAGTNSLQNFPVITSVTSFPLNTTVQGTLNSVANESYAIEFFANTVVDPSGFGEGQTYLGSTNVTTDASGNATFSVTLPVVTSGGQFVTATATRLATLDTSEFSGNTVVGAACVEVASLIVTTVSDVVASDCVTSLREAMNYANSRSNLLNPGGVPDVISFNIPGVGVHTIQPITALPTITDPVIIDGYTQAGASVNTLVNGNNAALTVELSGSAAGVGASGLVITAGNSTVTGLAIHSFSRYGIQLALLGGNNIIKGNFLGTDATGNVRRGNGGGVYIYGSSDNRIGTNSDGVDDPGERNLFIGNYFGIYIETVGGYFGDRNIVAGNYIGTDRTGTITDPNTSITGDELGNGVGIQLLVASHNTIGGTTPVARNLVAGSPFGGIFIQGTGNLGATLSTHNVVQGNFIGTDVTGTVALPNHVYGVFLATSEFNTIGGTAPGAGNVISATLAGSNLVIDGGLSLDAVGSNTVQGNFIGTDVTGTQDLGSSGSLTYFQGNGISVTNSNNNLIGGTTSAARNLISGNEGHGILFNSSDFGRGLGLDGNTTIANVVQGNYIGTDVTGTLALGNTNAGVTLINSPGNNIGGNAVGAGNLISGNGRSAAGTFGAYRDGVLVSSNNNVVQGNSIGVSSTGAALGNYGNGVAIQYSTGTVVGGATSGTGNHIANNALSGVMVISVGEPTGTRNTIRGNSIEANGGLGIDLGGNNVTLNDLGDTDTGANSLQNFPLLTSVASSVSGTTITGSLNSTPNTTFTLDFYANTAADPSGYGEGQTYLGAATVSTDATGNVNYSVSVPGVAPVGQIVSATATNPAGSTSEFSGNTVVVAACVEVASLIVTTTSDVVANDCQTSLREAINYANSRSNSLNPGSVPDVISFNIPGSGVQTIQPLSALPWIVDPVVIDGYTQPGSSVNTSVNGGNAVINIELDGSQIAGGLILAANNNIVRGLAINNFPGAGIFLYYSDSNIIAGNFIGTDATGTIARPNDLGIKIFAAKDNIVGGYLPADRNVLSGNKYDGINVQGTYNPTLWLSTGNQILGNFAGTDATGTVALPNGSGGFDGVGINIGGGSGNRVANNLVSGNGDGGIVLGDYATVVEGNSIGTDVTGTLPLGNTGIYGNGISVYGVGNQIGGTGIGQANLIAHNAGAGIYVSDVPTYVYPSSSVVSIRGNSIHSNGGLGIDLAPFLYSGVTSNDIYDADLGPNNYQNFPLLASVQSSVSGTTITGTLNSTPLTIFALDFFANAIADPSGYGEGRTYLGAATVTTDANGDANFNVTVAGVAPVGQFVSATATSSAGSTSEFSGIGTVIAKNTSPTNLVLNSATINENGTFTLSGSFSDADPLDTHTVTINWGEGLPEVRVLPVGERNFSFSHQYLDDNPTITNSDLVPISVQLSDGSASSISASTNVTIKNVAPTNLSWTLSTLNINESGSVTVNGSFADVGTLDVHKVTINWGEGLTAAYSLPVGARTFSISHQYLDDNPSATPSDKYVVSLSMSDDDSGEASLTPSLIYGLKSRNGGAVVGSISPTHLYSFSSDGTNFTDIGAVKIGSTNIDADALAYSPTHGLFGYRIHSVANSNAAPTNSTFLSINPTTAVATPIGGLISGRVIRAAAFDSADRLWVVDRLQNELLQIDPSNGQIVGTPVTITLNGNPSNIISDLAVRDDGTFIATDFTVGAVFYSLDIHTGVLTQIAADTALQAPAQGSTRPTAFGIVAVGNIVFTYDAQGTDDIYQYDTNAGFTRSLVFPNIIPLSAGGFNCGQGDLAIAAVNHLVTVYNVAPVIDTLSATSMFASGLVQLTGTYHDDGSQDTHSLTVDWGDGSPVSILVPTAGLLMGTHVYSTQGNYTISVSLTDDDTGATSATTSVVVVLGRSLTGSVYVDADNDGVRDSGESGLFGVQVHLNGTNDLGESINVSTWTDIVGNYRFDQLRPGYYSLIEDQPVGYLDGKDTIGSLGNTSANDQFFVELSGEQDGSGYIFGELLSSRLTGQVFDDTNDNGLFDSGEPGVPGAEVRLIGTNDLSEIVDLLGSTDANGNYSFENLRPGTYSIHNLQPGGYLDGRDSMGSLGGTMSNDLFAGITLNSGSVGSGYNFGEHEDVGLVRGQTATIGYWQNNNGQALIRSLNGGANSTALSNWLATNFSNMYGAAAGANNLFGKTNSQVADFYVTLFKRKGQKLDAQVLATALAVYVTDLDLAGNNAQAFGFTVTSRGTGAATYNIQGNGLAFGVANNTRLTILQILRATNAGATGGNLYGGNSSLRNLANTVFDGINTGGDI